MIDVDLQNVRSILELIPVGVASSLGSIPVGVVGARASATLQVFTPE